MKRIVFSLTLVVATYFVGLAQTFPGYIITYKNTAASDQQKEVFVKSWVTKDYSKTFTADGEESTACITDHAKNEYTVLFPYQQIFLKIDDVKIYNENTNQHIAIDFSSLETKTIAGYTCKLARAKIDFSQKLVTDSMMNIWYTTELPAFFWHDFSSFKNIPGAVLQVDVQGRGMEAQTVERAAISSNEFGVPVFYKDQNKAWTSASNEEQVAENLRTYYEEETGLYGLKDTLDQLVLSPCYKYISSYDDGVAIVIDSTYNYYGSINLQGEVVLSASYEYLEYNADYKAYIFGSLGKKGLMDERGEVLIPANHELLYFAKGGYLSFVDNKNYGVIDRHNHIIIPAKFGFISDISSQTFIVFEKDKYQLYSLKTKKKIGKVYDSLGYDKETNLVMALAGDKYGFIDETGKVIIPITYYYTSLFTNGMTVVMETADSEPFILNPKGELIGTDINKYLEAIKQ